MLDREQADREQAALIEKIIRSQRFAGTGAKLRVKLLQFLFARRHEEYGVKSREILEIVFSHLKLPTSEVDDDILSDVRHHCTELRRALNDFNLTTIGQRQLWRCELPDAIPSEGYKLVFVYQGTSGRPTLGFWYAHIRPELDVKVVCNEPLVYRNPSTNMVFRFTDMAAGDATPEEAMQFLKQNRPDLYAENVYTSRTYMLSGEVEARDYIEDWFAAANRKISKGISRSMTQAEIEKSSPILLGNTRTNQFMRNTLKHEGRHLDLRVFPEKFGIVEVHNATPQELHRLRTECRMNLQSDGEVLVLRDQPQQDVFAIVTRIPNPSGEGAVTIICSDYTQCLGQVARTLTDDARLGASLELLQWPLDKQAPVCFQALIAVRLRGTETRKPVLIAVHAY